MKPQRGKLTVISAFGAGLLTLAAAGLAFRGAILEEWHLRKLDAADEGVRRAAAERLAAMGSARAVPKLIEHALAGEGPYPKECLIRTGSRAIPGLLQALQRKDPTVERLVTTTIRSIGSRDPRTAVEALLAVLDGGAASLRGTVVDALGSLGTDAEPAIQRLLELLQGPDRDLVVRAAMALGRIGPRSTPRLLALLRGRPEKDPLPAYTALIAVQNQHGGVVAYLAEALDDPDTRFAVRCADLLCGLGASAWEAVPALRRARDSPDAALREAAARALSEAGE